MTKTKIISITMAAAASIGVVAPLATSLTSCAKDQALVSDLFALERDYNGKVICNGFKKDLNRSDVANKLSGKTSLVFPAGVQIIAPRAFVTIDNKSTIPNTIKTIELPASTTAIGSYAFYAFEGLESLDLSEAIDFLGEACFSHCTNLKKVTMASRTTTANDNQRKLQLTGGTFGYNPNLQEVTLPAQLDDIGDEAFAGCTSLNKLDFSSIHHLWDFTGKNIFKGDTLDHDCKVIVANNMIGESYAFGIHNGGLSCVTQQNGTSFITFPSIEPLYKIFDEEISYKDIQISSTVTLRERVIKINGKFYECSPQTLVTACKEAARRGSEGGGGGGGGGRGIATCPLYIPTNATYVGGFFNAQTNESTLPDDITSIEWDQNDYSITDYDEPYEDTTTYAATIYDNAFQNSPFTTIDAFPSWALIPCFVPSINGSPSYNLIHTRVLDRIGDGAFMNSAKLEKVGLSIGTRYVGAKAFDGCSKLGTLDVSNFGNLSPDSVNIFFGADAFKGMSSVTDGKLITNSAMSSTAWFEAIKDAGGSDSIQINPYNKLDIYDIVEGTIKGFDSYELSKDKIVKITPRDIKNVLNGTLSFPLNANSIETGAFGKDTLDDLDKEIAPVIKEIDMSNTTIQAVYRESFRNLFVVPKTDITASFSFKFNEHTTPQYFEQDAFSTIVYPETDENYLAIKDFDLTAIEDSYFDMLMRMVKFAIEEKDNPNELIPICMRGLPFGQADYDGKIHITNKQKQILESIERPQGTAETYYLLHYFNVLAQFNKNRDFGGWTVVIDN